MKTAFTRHFLFFVAFFLSFGAVTAQTYQLNVLNGYGSGQYAAGDTVHIWSEEWPISKVFSHWSGQTSFLEMPDEWHTRVIMPAQNVTVTGNTKFLLPGTAISEEHFMGRDTIKQVFYYFPAQPKGVVWLFHGTGGTAESWVSENFEQVQFTKQLMADTLAVIVIECEDRTKNTDIHGDGNIRWEYNFDSVANVDIANIRAVRDTFIHRGYMNWSTPQAAAGFSAGGSFSTLITAFFGWKAAVNHNTPGVQPVIDQTDTPILFSMTWRDQHPEVGPQGNIDAYNNYQYLLNKGVCTQFYMSFPSPVYPERFKRFAGITTATSSGLFNELQNNGCLSAKNFLLKSPGEIALMVVANPSNWPVLLSLTFNQRNFVSDELEVMWATHHFQHDFNAKDLRFIKQACGSSVSVQEPADTYLAALYPNPASQTVTLPANTERVRVFTLAGHLVMEKNMAGAEVLDVSAWATGFYLLELTGKGQRRTAKLWKQ